jgi:prepilin-type processing-associated H-X9-DG protein
VVEETGEGCGGIRLLVVSPMGIARQAYLRDARILVCPGQRAAFPAPQARSDDFLHAPHNDSGMSYGYFYVPDATDTHTRVSPIFKKFERHSVRQQGAASVAIMAELTASRRKGRKNPDWHGTGGNVLFLDGHVAWRKMFTRVGSGCPT